MKRRMAEKAEKAVLRCVRVCGGEVGGEGKARWEGMQRRDAESMSKRTRERARAERSLLQR